MKTKITSFLVIALLSAINVYSQTRVTIPAPAYLNESILGDTLPNGTHPDKIYVLQRGGTYYVRGAFENLKFKLNLVAESGTGAMPIVRADLSDNGTQNWYMIACQQDVSVDGILFDAQSANEGYGPANWCFVNLGKNTNMSFTNCIFANTGQGGVGTWNAANIFRVNNCKFYNMGNITFSDQGAGRMIETRDSQIERLIITNNTLVNSYDRLVRHRNGAGVIKNMEFSNNTIINHGGYFGFMELGNVGDTVKITNNLVINGMSFGADQSDATRLTEFNMHTEKDALGQNKIVWIGSVPNDSTKYILSNNVYSVSSELATFYTANNVSEGPIMTDFIKAKISNPTTAWVKKSVSVTAAPAAMTDLVSWYYLTKKKGVTPDHDYNRMTINYMLNTLNCKYNANDIAFMGTNGKPVGDSSWGSSVINSLKNNMIDKMDLANYPNPFSDKTVLRFSLSVSSNVNVEITDVTGKQIRNENLGRYNSGTNSVIINRNELKSGMYFLKINAEQEHGTLVLMVK
jgi:hypothetical protein